MTTLAELQRQEQEKKAWELLVADTTKDGLDCFSARLPSLTENYGKKAARTAMALVRGFERGLEELRLEDERASDEELRASQAEAEAEETEDGDPE